MDVFLLQKQTQKYHPVNYFISPVLNRVEISLENKALLWNVDVILTPK